MGVIDEISGKDWTLYHGDSCTVLDDLPENSIDFDIHSPPFANIFIYSDMDADMGNCADMDEFLEHYEFLITKLLRVTVPGRLCAVHCKDLPKYANRDDTSGLIDFPGRIVQSFEKLGWSFHSRVTIWKCPVIERERTNNVGLLHKTVLRDRSILRQGMADYLLVFRKAPPPGTLLSDKPVGTDEGFTYYIGHNELDPRFSMDHPCEYSRKTFSDMPSVNVWRRYAEPVWWDIDQMDVLNYRRVRKEDDVKHICPLQMGVIRRAIQIWSNPGDVVLSPFAGIGSEGVGALREGRRFVGVELNKDYFHAAIKELRAEDEKARQTVLF